MISMNNRNHWISSSDFSVFILIHIICANLYISKSVNFHSSNRMVLVSYYIKYLYFESIFCKNIYLFIYWEINSIILEKRLSRDI